MKYDHGRFGPAHVHIINIASHVVAIWSGVCQWQWNEHLSLTNSDYLLHNAPLVFIWLHFCTFKALWFDQAWSHKWYEMKDCCEN